MQRIWKESFAMQLYFWLSYRKIISIFFSKSSFPVDKFRVKKGLFPMKVCKPSRRAKMIAFFYVWRQTIFDYFLLFYKPELLDWLSRWLVFVSLHKTFTVQCGSLLNDRKI